MAAQTRAKAPRIETQMSSKKQNKTEENVCGYHECHFKKLTSNYLIELVMGG